jgi:histidinol phosphatase-like PHP family hydrolase
MTVENIAAIAKSRGVDGVILTPHFHKGVSDETAMLYEDSNEDLFLALREEINYYEKTDGSVHFLLSTEADILSVDGELSLDISKKAENALDLITPTMNYHPLLPLKFVGLTMGKYIDELHESGAYEKAAAELGGVSKVLSLMYETQTNAVRRCPYPAMLGHLFMAHSFHPYQNNCFGAKREHLELMKEGVSQLIAACRDTDTFIDLTGVHLIGEQTAKDKIKNNDFLVEFQRFVIQECQRMGVFTYYGSDAHSLSSVGKNCADYFALVLR